MHTPSLPPSYDSSACLPPLLLVVTRISAVVPSVGGADGGEGYSVCIVEGLASDFNTYYPCTVFAQTQYSMLRYFT
jgi:hypothetical protein